MALLLVALLPWPYWDAFVAAWSPPGLPAGLPPLQTLAADVHSPLPHRHPAGADYQAWRWLGYQASETEPAAGGEIGLSIYWQPQMPDLPPSSVRARLIHPNDYLRQGDRTVSLSEAPITVTDGIGRSQHTLAIPPGTPPGLYQIEMELTTGGRALRLLNSIGRPKDGRLLLGPIAMRRGPAPAAWPGDPVGLDWGGVLRLESREVLAANPQQVRLALHWRSLAPMAEPYRLSLRLVDDEGHRWGQQDSQPLDGAYPTTLWQPGEAVREWHDLRPIPETPPGRYQLELRVYSLATGREMEVHPSGGTAGRIGEVVLQPASIPGHLVEVPLQLNRAMGDGLDLLGTWPLAGEARPGEVLEVSLLWGAKGTIPIDYTAEIELRGPAGELWGQRQVPPANADYPTGRWRSGETLRGQYGLRLRGDAGPGTGRLSVTLVDPAAGWRSEAVALGEVQVPARERSYIVPAMQHRSDAELGGAVRLLGFDRDGEVFKAGDRIPLTLYWQAVAPMDRSYTVFVQLLGVDGRLYGQQDTLPEGGRLPTTGWATGEVIIDHHEIPVAEGAPPGEYRIIAGMYDAASGARLPVAGAAGKEGGNYMVLGTVTLGSGQ